MRYGCEDSRLMFLLEHDGLEGTISYVKRTLRSYTGMLRAERRRGFRIAETKRTFILSCMRFRQFLKDNNEYNNYLHEQHHSRAILPDKKEGKKQTPFDMGGVCVKY